MSSMQQVLQNIGGDFRAWAFQGYPTMDAAKEAFKVAEKAGFTSTTSLPLGDLPVTIERAPRPVHSSDLNKQARMAGRAYNDLWYVSYIGIRPGVYPTWIECSMSSEWVVDGDWQKFASFEDARAAYKQAKKAGETRQSRVACLAGMGVVVVSTCFSFGLNRSE
uniref:Ribonuclease H1 N-terminal domain-containing protein n=1 Tax=Mycena chlorophos TaxID=658473 RepID=A0ABQ0L329_MYCCL|nr:predicted protein [Mycena chlorophos]